MSYWTYCTGVIQASIPQAVYRQDVVMEYSDWAVAQVKAIADITGSERNVYVFCSPGERNGFIGDGPYSRETYVDVTISLHGRFRDRVYQRTRDEAAAFIERLKEYFDVSNVSLLVQADIGDTVMFTSYDVVAGNVIHVDTDIADYDMWFRTALGHWEDFCREWCTKERMVDAIQLLSMMPFDVFEDVLGSHPLDRMIVWNYMKDYVIFRYRRGFSLPKMDAEDMRLIKEEAEREAAEEKENDEDE